MNQIDARGWRCPQPIIELGKAIAVIESGEEIHLLSDDPATEPDLKAWSRMTGNKFSKIDEFSFRIIKS
ncbi:MAG: sulfurtransferase TusA family protein [Candidatus Planktophila sp.]|jgi:tRNA 2-thiouridine synthesizing protein A